MRRPSIALAVVVLALSAGPGRAAIHKITVRNFGATFRVAWWDDGRIEPYRISSAEKGVYSTYTFDAFGGLVLITVDGEEFVIGEAAQTLDGIGSAMPLSIQEELGNGDTALDHHHPLLYDCSDCRQTWNTMCDIGLEAVCNLSDQNTYFPAGVPQTAVALMCEKFGNECQASARQTCANICTEAVAGACYPNPCENVGSCSADPAGGHVCSCASGYGGMACQIDTSPLSPFYIEIEFIGTWTNARRAVFQSAADRWSEVVTHVPCGGNPTYPAGRLLISCMLKAIDGSGGTFGAAGPTDVWQTCPTISLLGVIMFDIADIEDMEDNGTFEGIVLHEMGHVIGVGTLWGIGFGGCTTCRENGDPAWTCPAALSAYADYGGLGGNIVELDGVTGTDCSHLDEDIFDDELMTGFVDNVMHLSKMTAAILDDLDYIVDPSAVDPYTLPSKRGASIVAELVPSIAINDTAVDTIIHAMDDVGNVVEEKVAVMMEF